MTKTLKNKYGSCGYTLLFDHHKSRILNSTNVSFYLCRTGFLNIKCGTFVCFEYKFYFLIYLVLNYIWLSKNVFCLQYDYKPYEKTLVKEENFKMTL